MMDNIEIENLTDEELLTLYNDVVEHLEYLAKSIISLDEDGGDSDE